MVLILFYSNYSRKVTLHTQAFKQESANHGDYSLGFPLFLIPIGINYGNARGLTTLS